MCIYKVKTKFMQCIPPPPNYFGKEEKKEKEKGKEMYNLFCACRYFEEDILNQNR